MGNQFGIPGLGTEPVRDRRDVNERDSETNRPPKEFGNQLGTNSTVVTSQPEYITKSRDQLSEFRASYNGA